MVSVGSLGRCPCWRLFQLGAPNTLMRFLERIHLMRMKALRKSFFPWPTLAPVGSSWFQLAPHGTGWIRKSNPSDNALDLTTVVTAWIRLDDVLLEWLGAGLGDVVLDGFTRYKLRLTTKAAVLFGDKPVLGWNIWHDENAALVLLSAWKVAEEVSRRKASEQIGAHKREILRL